MANRWAFIVAIEKPLHAELGTCPYAENDAKALRDALTEAGVAGGRQVVLLGPHATKTAVESYTRSLKKLVKKGDEFLVFWAGPGHTDGDRGYLRCWDTLPSDGCDTALPLAAFVSSFEATKAGQVVYFLSVPGLSERDADLAFCRSAKSVGLLACSTGEAPYAAPAIKHGLWSQLVVEGLKGHARKAITPDGTVTTLSLQRFVEEELPRRLRKHVEGHVRQTPRLLGDQHAGTVLLRVAHGGESSGAVLDVGRLRRLVFRSDSTSRVRDLTNFRKTFSLPDSASPANRKFVQRIATDNLKAEMERVVEDCREQFGYKRKDLHLVVGQDGTATMRTPDFEYTLFVDLQTEDPSQLTWRREVGQFADADFIRSAEFQKQFGAAFDQLVFEFAKPVDVSEFIDRVEDASPDGMKLKIGDEGKSCEIALTGFSGTVSVKRHALVVRGRSATATGLLDLFLQFLSKFGALGEPLALPPAR